MDAPREPRTINLETPHYIVRTLEPADATDAWRDWLTDPATARMLNARPDQLSAEAIRAYIQRFDRTTTHLLGIFEKETARLIGVRAIYVNWPKSEFLVNILIGETEARNKGARSETRTVMYRYFFEEMGLDAACCTVLATNTPILNVVKRNGWIHERSEHKPEASGQGTVEILQFRLPRDVWRRKEIENAQARPS